MDACTHTHTQAHTLFIAAAGGGFEAVTDCPAKLLLSTESLFSLPALLFDATFVINSDKSSDSSLLMCARHVHTRKHTSYINHGQ